MEEEQKQQVPETPLAHLGPEASDSHAYVEHPGSAESWQNRSAWHGSGSGEHKFPAPIPHSPEPDTGPDSHIDPESHAGKTIEL